MAPITDQIAGLADLPPARLRAEWRRLHRGQPMPDGMSRDLLARGVAWRMQEKVVGGLSSARVRELDRLAQQLVENGELDLEHSSQLKAGTRLVRQWHERVYVATVLDEGYDYEGRHYPSLTPIAREITGAAWSGPRFFGIKSRTGKGSDAEK